MNRLKRLGKMFDNVGRNFALQRGVYGQSFTGQLGKAVVGGTWKDKKTLRTYAVPTNPNTAGQVSQRAKFKISQVVGSSLLLTVVRPYWNPFVNSQSGFNAFIGDNSQLVTGNTDFGNIRTVKGPYEPAFSFDSFTYDSATGNCAFNWDNQIANIGDVNDQSLLVVLDITDYAPEQKTPILLGSFKLGAIRDADNDSITIKDGLAFADIYGYIAFKQPAANPILTVSNSLARQATAL